MKLFKQNDLAWRNNLLGFSSFLTIGSHGCLVTCLGMITDTEPDMVNTRLKSVSGFSGALVIWSKISSVFPQLKFVWRAYRYDNISVLSQIKRNGFCIVEAKNRFTGSTHWVVFIGSQRLLDPATGTERNTSTYNSFLWRYSGFAAIDKV